MGISFRINRYFIVAWLLPVVIVILTPGVNLLFPQVHYSPDMGGFFERLEGQLSEEQLAQMKEQMPAIHPFWLGLIQGLIAGLTINALFAFGEELGWRGYLLKACQPLGFWKASLFIGVI
ncbi:membrane protease YdiL (CAAX protease family) [Caldalkalibacillus uzonensis]|uniref:Membrane protease YdiL (CAAX protease family) n=1 Tax=Caldalkalibacillus uzonensis TaxID=353224 RepID=A0ABU0CU83_9BACI|nr:hypothetical protein [Caldalkalibacillus uzonensis]MDQ0339970.1 membrane protease YdiL (CAAX protease family) [Caldalkalibacillus uzonensis]